MRVRVFPKTLRVEIENETRVFPESLIFETEMRVSQKSAPKPMKSDRKWKSQSGGPFSILQAWFGGHLGVVFCKFCNQNGFSEAYFSVFPAFTKRQNPFPLQKGGNRNGNGF